MKISQFLTTSGLALTLAFGLTACGDNHSANDGHDHEAEAHSEEGHAEKDGSAGEAGDVDHAEHAEETHGLEFQEGKGLRLPDKASDMLGVKMVDVTEGGVSAPLDLSLRVFRSADKTSPALASGSISTNDAALLRVGQEVQISSAKETPGVITKIQNLSNAVGLAEIVVELPSASGLQTGTFIDAVATVTSSKDAVVIPKEALLETAEGHFVYVVNGDHLFRTQVKVGLKGTEIAEVTEGLYSGDQVVLQPVMPLWLAELQSIRGGQSCTHGH